MSRSGLNSWLDCKESGLWLAKHWCGLTFGWSFYHGICPSTCVACYLQGKRNIWYLCLFIPSVNKNTQVLGGGGRLQPAHHHHHHRQNDWRRCMRLRPGGPSFHNLFTSTRCKIFGKCDVLLTTGQPREERLHKLIFCSLSRGWFSLRWCNGVSWGFFFVFWKCFWLNYFKACRQRQWWQVVLQ